MHQVKSFCYENAKELLSENELSEYCECACRNINARYPNLEEVETMLEEKEMHSRLNEIIQIEISECEQEKMVSGMNQLNDEQKIHLKQDLTQWTFANEKKFIKASKNLIPKNLIGKVNMSLYCDCMKIKVMGRYPQFDSIQKFLKDRKLFESEFESDKQSCIIQSVQQ